MQERLTLPAYKGPNPPGDARWVAGLVRELGLRPAQVLDAGSGAGILGLLCLRDWAALGCAPELDMVEVDGALCELAVENVVAWGFGGQVRVVCGKVQDYTDGPYDVVVTNPPFHLLDKGHKAAGDRGRVAVISGEDLRDWFRALGRVLAPEGVLVAVVHPSNLEWIEREGWVVEERPITTHPERAPKRVLLVMRRAAPNT